MVCAIGLGSVAGVARVFDVAAIGAQARHEELNGQNRTWFAGADFMQYLQQHRFGNVAEKEVWRWLREKGAGHEFKKVKGKGINLWWVPTFPEQAEEHPAPRLPKEEPF